MRILFAGTPQVAVPSLRALAGTDGIEVAAVLTRPDAPSGRGRRLKPSAVKIAAGELGIPVLDDDPADPAFIDALGTMGIEAAAVVAYGRILRQPTLAAVPRGWYNLHFSRLPQWRGAAPAQRAVWSGQPVTGATVFRITAGMDEGPILLQSRVEIGGTETSGQLLDRMAHSEADLLVRAMLQVADGSASPVEQSAEGVSLADKIGHDDAHIDFRRGVDEIDRQIRACTPDPGAWCMLTPAEGAEPLMLHVLAARAGDPDASVPGGPTPAPGRLVVGKRNVWVGAADGVMELLEVKAQGKKAMRAADWARGARLGEGACCA